MGATPRKKAQIEYRRLRVGQLLLKGWTQAQIARELGVSQGTVSLDMAANRKLWETQRLRDADALMTQEALRLVQILQAVWEEIERAKLPRETTRIVQKNGNKSAEKTAREHPVDPRLFTLALNISQQLRELLGLKPEGTRADAEPASLNWDQLYAEADKARDANWIEQQIREAGKRKPT